MNSFWNHLLPTHLWVNPRQWRDASALSSSLYWESFASHNLLIFFMQTAYLKHKKTFWKQVGRDIKNVSNPFFSLKVRIRCTCTFQENYLFELILKILSQWRSHQLLRQCALLALCLKQKYFILSNLYIPCNLSSLLKSWTLLNHYQGSKRAFFFSSSLWVFFSPMD